MISGKFFDQLVESTIKLARALETDNVSTQLDLVFRSISGLFDNLKELSNQKFSSVPIRIDHANNLENQVKIAKNILSLSGTIISLSKQLSKSQITAQRYKNLLELRDKLKKSVEILREGYQKFHLNQTFYSHSFDANQLRQTTNDLSSEIRQLIPVITSFKNNLQK